MFEIHGEDVEAALDQYQRSVRVRTARVQLDSRLIGEYIYHPDGAIAEVRNHIMSNLTPEQCSISWPGYTVAPGSMQKAEIKQCH